MPQSSESYLLYKQAFHAYYKPLCQYGYTLVKDIHDCEDIVQEIFLHVWEKKREIIGDDALRFYLFTAVRNKCINHLKKNKPLVFTELSSREEPADPAASGRHDVDFSVLVADALDRLPLKCREVFMLSRISKLTYQQIAEASGISIKTVENQIGKALKIMRSFVREKQLLAIIMIIYVYLC